MTMADLSGTDSIQYEYFIGIRGYSSASHTHLAKRLPKVSDSGSGIPERDAVVLSGEPPGPSDEPVYYIARPGSNAVVPAGRHEPVKRPGDAWEANSVELFPVSPRDISSMIEKYRAVSNTESPTPLVDLFI